MSRELLKCVIAECSDEGSCSNISTDLYCAITEYLEMPEPEPVAFVSGGTVNWIQPQAGVLKDKQPLYASPPDQSTRIAELEKDNDITHGNLAWYMEKYHEHLTIIADMEKSEAFLKDAVDRAIQDTEYYQEQLAALQAKRDPLSDDEIQDIHNELPSRSTYYEFARAIEAAHGIGTNHD